MTPRDKSLDPPFYEEHHGIGVFILKLVAICAFIGLSGAVLVAHWSDILGWSISSATN